MNQCVFCWITERTFANHYPTRERKHSSVSVIPNDRFYLLFEIEKQHSGQRFDAESATYNLEHVLPENPSEAWDYIDEAKQNRLIYRLGNMTPMETKQNKDIGNAGYAVKRPVFEKSDFAITRAIAQHYDTWDEQKII